MIWGRFKRNNVISTKALHCGALAAAVAMTLNHSARAIDERDDVPDSQYTQLSTGSQYQASGYVEVNPGQGFASATLIAPDMVLTAAHVVEPPSGTIDLASSLSFGQGPVTTLFHGAANSVSQIWVNPLYNPTNVILGGDMSLLQLSTPITNVTPAAIYNSALGSEIGQTITFIGYGYTGTGLTGYQNSTALGVRRGMQNVIDAFGGDTTTGGPSQTNTYSFDGFSPDIMMSDFDEPGNPSVSIMGDTTPLPLEGAVVPGDSGGGAYITVNGRTYLAGVASFVGAFSDNIYSATPDGHYGDFNGYTRLSVPDNLNFLNSVMVTNSSWNQTGGGTWASLADWNNTSIPEYMMATANFGGAIQSSSVVTLDDAWTAGTVTFNNTNSYTIAAGNGGSLTLDNGGAGTTAALTDNGGTHLITAPLALNSNLVATIVNPGDVLTLSGPITGGTGLTVAGSGILRFAHGVGTPTFSSVAVNSGATLDITSNAIAINYGSPGNSPVAAIAALLGRGYNGGTWTGLGIDSSAAAVPGSPKLSVGYADGNADVGTMAQPNQVLIKFTLAGDSNLDGSVDFADLATILKYFNQPNTDWSQGNFEYATSGATTNFNDLADVLKNFLQTAPGGGSSEELGNNSQSLGLSAAVSVSTTGVQLPEPGLLAPVLSMTMLIGCRRRRNGPRCL